MEAKELCNITVSPLVIGPFSTEWSADNHISLITERGVHVFVSKEKKKKISVKHKLENYCFSFSF